MWWSARATMLGLALASAACGGVTEHLAADSGAPTASVAAVHPRIEIELPRAATFQSGELVFFAVEIDAKGAMSIDDKPVTDGEVIGIAKAAHARDPATRALIRADQAASWNAVVHAVDLVKQGGIAQIAFGVAPAPASASAAPMAPPNVAPLFPAPPRPPVPPPPPPPRPPASFVAPTQGVDPNVTPR